MYGTKKNWLSLLLLLVALAAPITAKADFYWTSNPGGGTGGGDDTGDPDSPLGPRMAPGQRSGGTGGSDSRYQVNRPLRTDSWLMRRYLTLLSGLRSYYLRF